MNYLVHLYLSGPDPEHQLGGLMGDFIKGPLPEYYPAGVRQGLYLHRRIDSFAHSHPDTRRSRHRLHPRYGHGRGIIVDIFYDHFLAASWSSYATERLPDYAERVYRLLGDHHHRLPARLQDVARRMTAQNWLVSYRHRDAVGKALQRISQRLSRPLPLADAVEDLIRHEEALREDFARFIADAQLFAETERTTMAEAKAPNRRLIDER